MVLLLSGACWALWQSWCPTTGTQQLFPFPDGVDRNMELLVLPSAQSWEISKMMDEEVDPNTALHSRWQLSLMDSFLIFI